MRGALLGPTHSGDAIATGLTADERPFVRIPDPTERADRVAQLLDEGAVIGVFQGPMEFGPRALGDRSIIADPRRPEMQRQLNVKIKQRESFRPFAPAVLAEEAAAWFALSDPSPYMLTTAPVLGFETAEPGLDEAAVPAPGDVLDLARRLDAVRSPIPAVTHVDGSARVQTVDAVRAPHLHPILQAFHRRTGCPVLVNTSFNVRGEPIVCRPDEACRCFMTTDMDWLLLEDCLLDKAEQPPWTGPDAPVVDD
jgi:carbamoyltransferase